MKNCLLSVLFALFASVLCLLPLLKVSVKADAVSVPSVDYATVVFKDAVDLRYFVKSEDTGTTKLLVWKSIPENKDFYLDTADDVLTDYTIDNVSVEGEVYKAFTYDKVSAKQMGDTYYVCALHIENGYETYSNIVKYSVQQYVQNMKTNYTGEDRETLIPLLEGMLDYGALAQTHFNYNTDRLVNAENTVNVKINSGWLKEDDCRYGIYYPGDIIDIDVPKTNAQGKPFSCWYDQNNDVINVPYTVVGNEGELTFTAFYGEITVNTSDKPTIVTTAKELQNAIDNKHNGVNYIKLGNSISGVTTAIKQSNNDNPFVLDLGGFAFTSTSDIQIYGSATIKNGTVNADWGIIAYGNSNLTLNDLTVNATKTFAVRVLNNATIENCTVTTITQYALYVSHDSAGKTVTANNVSLTAPETAYYHNGSLGTFTLDGINIRVGGYGQATYHTHADNDGDGDCDIGGEAF